MYLTIWRRSLGKWKVVMDTGSALHQLSKPLLPFADDLARRLHRIPAGDFRLLALEFLVDGKEMLDLTQGVGKDLGAILYLAVQRVALGDGQDFFVLLALVNHAQHADGADFHQASGKARRLHQHQHVQRVAIQTQRRGDETVVAGIMDRRKKSPVQAKHVELLVILVLIDRVPRDL